jgi:hypothetical protein
MKLSNLWKNQQILSRDLTEHSRKLAFAVAAICWFFTIFRYFRCALRTKETQSAAVE